MSQYTDYPGQFVRVAGTDRYTATLPLLWDIGKPGSGFTVTVPALYEHDVSIPALLTWAFNRHEPKYQRASRLHDWLLDLGWDRVTSAGIFNDALKADGVSASRRWLMTSAVAFYRWS